MQLRTFWTEYESINQWYHECEEDWLKQKVLVNIVLNKMKVIGRPCNNV